ncbi:MAG: purine-nucleoside phosphorylase [Clostridiales bacterium]|nr:purine-nucleoside phosphorylase [Clostridiales bacterium]
MTPHLEANYGDIAETVLMPGDPLRAKFIAENFLENPRQYNSVRGMLGFTGTYKGKSVSVQGSGMGIPSIGIYSYELYKFYGVKNIIRIGTAGAIADELKIKDIVLAQGACTNSNYASQYNLSGTFAPIADYSLLTAAAENAKKKGVKFVAGNVLTSDTFYGADTNAAKVWKSMGVLAVEMECAALYMNAAYLQKKALGILTVSDHIFRDESASAEERRVSFTDMMVIALETAVSV